MPKAKSSQAGHKKRIPLVEPLQRTFCRTAADFAAIHGLSSVGKDPRQIREISITDWTNVFSCPMPGPGQKIRHDEAKQEYHEDLILLHWKVYQELPKNGELGIYFAKGFAIERSKVAPEQINWAHFAEEAMNWLQKHNQLEGKMDRWQLKENRVMKRLQGSNIQGGISTPCSDSLPQPNASYGGYAPKLLLTKEEEDVLDEMVVSMGKKIADLGLEINEARGSLQEANNALHVAKGSLSQKSNFEEIQSLLAQMQGVSHIISKVQHLFPNEDEIRELETKVAATKATLEAKEITLEKARLNFRFALELQKKANGSAQILARPRLSAPHVEWWEGLSISGFTECCGCGHAFNACALDVFSLPCRHVYHFMCFVHMCIEVKKCVALECDQIVPDRTLRMLGLDAVSKSCANALGTEYVSMDFKDNSGDKLDETFTPFKFTYSHGSVVGDVKTIETTDTRRHSINKVVLEKTPEQAKEVTDVGEEDIVLTLAKQPAKSNLGFQDDGSASSGTPIGVEKNIPAHTPTAVEKNIPADTPKRRGTRSDPEWEEVDVQLQSPMRSPPKRSALEPPAESPSKCKDALEPPAKSPERCIGKRRSRNITSPRNTQRSRAAKNKKVPSERNQDPPKEAPTGNEDEEDVYLSSMFEAIRSKPSRKFVS